MRQDGVYKDAKSERSSVAHKKRRIRLWQERTAANPPKCHTCGKPLVAKYGRGWPRKYCSRNCRTRAYTQWKRLPFASGTVGTIGELLVSADLLVKGFAVFRALSPNCPCDLAVLEQGQLLRVEVTKGTRARSGKLIYSPHDSKRFDLMAVWCENGQIVYMPELEQLRLGAGPLEYSDEDGRAAGGEGVGAASIQSA